jgi:hypothetical protein
MIRKVTLMSILGASLEDVIKNPLILESASMIYYDFLNPKTPLLINLRSALLTSYRTRFAIVEQYRLHST